MSLVPLFVVLLIVIDKYCFSRVLQRPLITCTLLAAALGCTKEGMVVGASLELYYIAYQSYGEYAPIESGFLMTSLLATILVSNGTDSSTAISSSAVFLACGMAIAYVLNLVNTAFVPSARKGAEKCSDKKIFLSMAVPFVLDLVVYGAVAFAALQNVTTFQTLFTTCVSSYPWVMTGLSCISILLPCISFAILCRNIGVKDVPGAIAAGVAVGALLSLISATGVASGSIAGLLAASLAFYDFHAAKKQTNKEVKEVENKATNTIKGGAEKWW